jgi:hypothetical protein
MFSGNSKLSQDMPITILHGWLDLLDILNTMYRLLVVEILMQLGERLGFEGKDLRCGSNYLFLSPTFESPAKINKIPSHELVELLVTGQCVTMSRKFQFNVHNPE